MLDNKKRSCYSIFIANYIAINILKGVFSMKKLISSLCVLAILVFSTFSCFAAQDSLKSQILSELKSGGHTGTTTLYLPDKYINQAENYLNTHEITQEQADKILAKISDAKKLIATTNANSLKELKENKAVSDELLTIAQDTAAVVGLKLSYDGGGNFSITDETGTSVITNDAVIKTTGLNIDMTNAAVISVFAGIILISSGIVLYRKKVFSK